MNAALSDGTGTATDGPFILRRGGWQGRAAWALYGWANAPFTTLIITFIFPAYFGRVVVGDEVRGQELWAFGIGISGFLIAALSPILGAIADAGGRRKPWLLAFSALCIAPSALLWLVEPRRDFIAWALTLVGIANIGYGFGIVFSNAMLPDLVPRERLGRWSGWAWALGYAGGLAALVIALLVIVQTETPLFTFGSDRTGHVRAIGPFVGIWFALFAWPLFLWTPDRPRVGGDIGASARRGLGTLRKTFANLGAHRNIARFLLAQMFYADGLVTIFVFGGIYAVGAFRMTLAEVTRFGILLNVTAGLGAFGFAWLDDWNGSRRTILISLVGLIIASSAAVLVEDRGWFWIAGAALGLFVGPPQAASRSLMARLAPVGQETEFFGLLALSGRATAFLGPVTVGLVTALSGSQRVGISTVLAFFAIGVVLLVGVEEPKSANTSSEEETRDA